MLNRKLVCGALPRVLLSLLLPLMLTAAVHAAPAADLWPIWDSAGSRRASIDHSAWQQLLDRHLNAAHASGINRFAYSAVGEKDHRKLVEYLDRMQSIDPRHYAKTEQMAYWINLYNAVTVHIVLREWPVTTIREIGGGFFSRGPWNDAAVTIAGETLTLNDIEHRILRPIWRDPRIHFAVNCASLGCPNLAPRAYTAANLEALLTRGAREYLAHPRGARFEGNTLVLSKIFDWYREDFGASERDMIAAISAYADATTRDKLLRHGGRVKYEYNWEINSP